MLKDLINEEIEKKIKKKDMKKDEINRKGKNGKS